MKPGEIKNRLEALRNVMKARQADHYLMITSDPHGSEYINACYKEREYFSGFTGSNGDLLVSMDEALLWTDGRYFVQAEEALEGSGIKLMRIGQSGVPTLVDYIKEHARAGEHFMMDGRLCDSDLGIRIMDVLKTKRVLLISDSDLTLDVWTDRPADSAEKIRIIPDELSGKNASAKIKALISKIKEYGASSHIISGLDDQMWLFNIRGNDIKCNPVAYAYTVINGREVSVYLKNASVSAELSDHFRHLEVDVKDYDSFYDDLERMNLQAPVLIDPKSINYRIYQILRMKGKLIERTNPTALMKAVKNQTEIKLLKDVYIKDSVVLTRFLHFMKENAAAKGIDEYTAGFMLDRMRSEIKGFNDLSFPTISAFGSNAAKMHYEAEKGNCAKITEGSFYLVDSGGQYDGGTTDVTRTILIGDVGRKLKRHYTRVVTAMLRLQNTIFMQGCTGENLDIIAREPIWEMGMDYKCGTGHGIGYMLNVHEGPAAIRWRIKEKSDPVPILPGMLLSDEPGVYVAGSHGIRIENIILCEEIETNDDGTFLHFVPLTYVPIDPDGILVDEMEPSDLRRLNDYQAAVCDMLIPFMEGDDVTWLKRVTRELG